MSATSQTRFAYHFFPLCRTLFSLFPFLPIVYFYKPPLTHTRAHTHTPTHTRARARARASRIPIYITENRGVLPAGSRQEQFASLPNTPSINYQRHRLYAIPAGGSSPVNLLTRLLIGIHARRKNPV